MRISDCSSDVCSSDLADGTGDTSFASPGINFGTVFAITPQPDGKVLVGGSFSTAGGVARKNAARLNADGTLDTTFVDPNFSSTVHAFALQPDGKVRSEEHTLNSSH